MRRSRVPAVDPTKPRRVRKALVEPLARSGAGRWWLINVSPILDRAVFRLTGGRFTTIPANILTLTHTGARTGKRRENLLTYFTDGKDLIVMASNYGRERLWRLAKTLTKTYADYEERAANRTIQVIRLTPVGEAHT